MNLQRRLLYLGAFVLCMMLGLGSRAFQDGMPFFIKEHAGDALWAGMVYFGFRVLLVKRSFQAAAGGSLIFCFAIEFGQLYQADWLNSLRLTVLGALILGRGFLAADLARYMAGIALAWGVDYFILKRMFRA
ncbi:DUF2809 domain-containing protein [Paenibacillus sp. CAA11]|uniref:ribosomal maturation YjgA family protein n=1 Tax=Paenibacillus sp. CAA11 TaxID=1532905 RepID=UPI000D370A1D|nr:DUF2809 domain-containing protein [Paenibacillus sp. CAA11]AWB43637.1 DUF2809 domain-containing protein [Paenibacillus sp. CAA11]